MAKKLTKKQQAARDNEISAYQQAKLYQFKALQDRFDGKVFKAEVLWFDKLSGEGMVRGLDGEGTFALYACNIKGKRTWYETTACVYHEAGQVIDLEVMVFYSSNALAVSHTQGTFDANKWNSLDQSKLAFKCNEDGQAVNGLFA
jgi:hypothetical protein